MAKRKIFLQADSQGILFVKKEYLYCEKCGAKIEIFETTFLHGVKQLCRKCEKLHRMNERRKELKNRKPKTKKAVTK